MGRQELKRPKMTLPMPKPDDVEAFKALYKRRFSLELSSEEAYEIARKVIGIVYAQRQHPVLPLCEEEF